MNTTRKYSESQVAQTLVVLDRNNGNVYRTSKELNIPRKTICHWKEKYTQDASNEHEEAIMNIHGSLELPSKDLELDYLIKAQKVRMELLDRLSELSENSNSIGDVSRAFKAVNDSIIESKKYLYY